MLVLRKVSKDKSWGSRYVAFFFSQTAKILETKKPSIWWIFFVGKLFGKLGWCSKHWNFPYFFVYHPYSGLNTTHKIYRWWQSPSGIWNISQHHSMFFRKGDESGKYFYDTFAPLESIHTKEVSKNPPEYHYTTWPLLSCQQHWHWKILEHAPVHVPKNKIPSKKHWASLEMSINERQTIIIHDENI